MTDNFKITQRVDTCGLRCPIPLLRAKQALKGMQVGEYLEVLSTDPGAKPDFDAMLKHLPHELVVYSSGDGTPRIDRFVIRKG
jgi:tRNA 2-thiouridine synthesizing protein A